MNHVVYLADYLVDYHEELFARFEWLTMDFPDEDGHIGNLEEWIKKEHPDVYKAWYDLNECSARYAYEDEEARDNSMFVRQDYYDDVKW